MKVSEIDWIEAADYYACLHVGPKTHLLRRSMAELEQESGSGRVFPHPPFDHREPGRVRGLKLGEDGEYDVLLENGARLRLSQRYRKQLQSRLGIRLSNRQ